jgi:archaellum component FlaC
MSISATTNYMSSDTIEAWMEQKTEGLYGGMQDAMDVSNRRADAEEELNKIKSMLVDGKGKDTSDVRDEINAALTEYKDVPEVVTTLQPIAEQLLQQYNDAADASSTPGVATSGTVISAGSSSPTKIVVHLDSTSADNWSKSIGDTVDALGKQDQLGLINIQELNSQISQAQQIASALIDSANKSADTIVSHIG